MTKPAPKKAVEVRNSIVNILTGFAGNANSITIPKPIIKWCSKDIVVALFFSQALYWSGATTDDEGWFALSVKQWDEDTSLTRAQMDRAAVILEQVGLERKLKRSQWHDFTPVIHYRFNREILEKAAQAFFSEGITLNLKSTKESRDLVKKRKEDLRLSLGLDLKPRHKSNLRSKLKSDLSVSLKSDLNADIKSYEESSSGLERVEKETTLSAATHQSASSPQWPTETEGFFGLKGGKRIPAQADNLPKQDVTTPPIPQIAPAPLSPVATHVLAETDENAVDAAPVLDKKGKARKPNHTALVINAVWGKGVSGGLLPMLMGNAKKAPWKDHNIEGGMTEIEIFAFGRWYKKQNPGLNLVEQPPKVWAAITSFRDAIDYEGWMAEAEKLFPTYFPKEKPPAPPIAEEDRATPEDLAAFRRQILESGLQAELGHIVTSQENVS